MRAALAAFTIKLENLKATARLVGKQVCDILCDLECNCDNRGGAHIAVGNITKPYVIPKRGTTCSLIQETTMVINIIKFLKLLGKYHYKQAA